MQIKQTTYRFTYILIEIIKNRIILKKLLFIFKIHITLNLLIEQQ